MREQYVTIKDLSKSYRQNSGHERVTVEVFKKFNLFVKANEFVTFFGPNGCGKTTLMNIVSGLIPFDNGTVEINGKDPRETRIGYVFQNFEDSLYPWKTNLDNIAFPLELQGIPKNKRAKAAQEILDRFTIKIPEKGYPYQLSGGQKQLVAIARALIAEPQVLIMDEAFGQLDYETRISMQNQLLQIWDRLETTVLFVSHDVDEAILFGDRIVLLSKRPARIMEIVENPLPKPRRHDIMQSEEFFKLKNHALRVFTEALTA
jgi:NitT/TauT family transport system ATP-binding protein